LTSRRRRLARPESKSELPSTVPFLPLVHPLPQTPLLNLSFLIVSRTRSMLPPVLPPARVIKITSSSTPTPKPTISSPVLPPPSSPPLPASSDEGEDTTAIPAALLADAAADQGYWEEPPEDDGAWETIPIKKSAFFFSGELNISHVLPPSLTSLLPLASPSRRDHHLLQLQLLQQQPLFSRFLLLRCSFRRRSEEAKAKPGEERQSERSEG